MLKMLRKGLKNPRKFVEFFVTQNARFFKNDQKYLSWLWWCKMGYRINWENPQTFCEKIQWLKIHDRRSEYTKMVDKYAVKEYVRNRIGSEYIIPTLGVWDRAEDINWDVLPDRFVLKTTHGGGGNGVIICRDKTNFDKVNAVALLNKSMQSDIYILLREWPYKDVPKRIMAEQYMEDFGIDVSSCLTDYKFFCFDGIPRYCQVIKDRHTSETIDFFDMDWNHMEFIGLNPKVIHATDIPKRPNHFETMKSLAHSLAEGLVFSRIDLYEINGHEFFGEITLYPASGFGKFTPGHYDELLGRMIHLEGQKLRENL